MKPEYALVINVKENQIVECKFFAESDEAAALIMNDVLLSVVKHNKLIIDDLNSNLYKTLWVNGI